MAPTGLRDAARRTGRALVRAAAVAYGALALIPAGFTAAAAWSYVVERDKDKARAMAFWAWTGWLSLPLSVALFAVTPVALAADPVDRRLLGRVQKTWARWTLMPFFDVETVPMPARGGAAAPAPPAAAASASAELATGNRVVVSNHASWLDPYVLLAVFGDDVALRFLSKREIFFIPLVGWVMGLIGHVPLARGDKESGRSALAACEDRLRTGRAWSVVFFPEGSRPRRPELAPFKIGAFKLAVEAGVPVLPLAIEGTRDAMPPGSELKSLGPRRVLRVWVGAEVRPAAGPGGAAADAVRAEAMRDACREQVAQALEAAAAAGPSPPPSRAAA